MREDGKPGITLIGMAWQDRALAIFGRQWQAQRGLPLGATSLPLPPLGPSPADAGLLRVAVVGAHWAACP